ncbi:hypothetical protein FQZ97_344300 [compost metagenome]
MLAGVGMVVLEPFSDHFLTIKHALPSHGLIGRLASLPRYSPSICLGSIESSSLSNPAEHVGSHSGGVFGCLAELGSDGIAAGSAPPIGILISLLQPLESITSAISIGARLIQFPFRILLYLIHRLLAALFLDSGRCRGAQVALCDFKTVIAQVRLGPGDVTMQSRHPRLLDTDHCQGGQQPPEPCRHKAQQNHASTPPAAT